MNKYNLYSKSSGVVVRRNIEHPRADEGEIQGLDSDLILLKIINEDAPEYDSKTHILEPSFIIDIDKKEYRNYWLPVSVSSQVKTWPDVEHFMTEFTPDELADIQLSQDRTLAYLKIILSTWFSTVRADDERVLMGLGKLLELGIINQNRYNQILGL